MADKEAIGCKWVYHVKYKSNRSLKRYKAQLVAKGYNQKFGLDYQETFAPVAKLVIVHSLLAVTTTRN